VSHQVTLICELLPMKATSTSPYNHDSEEGWEEWRWHHLSHADWAVCCSSEALVAKKGHIIYGCYWGILSCAMTTPACHLTLPLASASLPIFFPHAPHPFCHFPPTTVLLHPFWPFSRASATFPHRFRFRTCFLCFGTLPTLYFIFIEPSAHFRWYLTIRTSLHLFVYMFWLSCMFL